MLDGVEKTTRPVPRVVLGPLKTATQIRCAFRRLGQAVLDGKIPPKVANSAMYAVSGAGRALELETAERVSRQLAEIEHRPNGSLLLQATPVVEGEVLSQ
jgi:hypothetical protein